MTLGVAMYAAGKAGSKARAAELEDARKRIAELEATCHRLWEISMLAQALIDNGESYAAVNGRLVEIAEACALALKR